MNRFKGRNKVESLKVTEAARIRLAALYQAQGEATNKLPEFQAWIQAFAATCDMLGLDGSQQGHTIDFRTGVVTPSAQGKPTLVKDEAAS